MESKAYRIPLAVTVSRKTGQITKVDWCENATQEEFLRVVDWMRKAGRCVLEARQQNGKNERK